MASHGDRAGQQQQPHQQQHQQHSRPLLPWAYHVAALLLLLLLFLCLRCGTHSMSAPVGPSMPGRLGLRPWALKLVWVPMWHPRSLTEPNFGVGAPTNDLNGAGAGALVDKKGAQCLRGRARAAPMAEQGKPGMHQGHTMALQREAVLQKKAWLRPGNAVPLQERQRGGRGNSTLALIVGGDRQDRRGGAGAGVYRRRLQERLLLDQQLKRESLASLDLGLYQQPGSIDGDGRALPRLGCKGEVCPDLENCDENGVQACHLPSFFDNGIPPAALLGATAVADCPPPGDVSGGQLFLPQCQVASGDWLAAKWQGQVIVLRDVFLNADGAVFNASHVFFPGGCSQDVSMNSKFTYGPKTELLEFPKVLNLAIGPRGRHRIFEELERLPLFLLLAPILHSGILSQARLYLGESKVLAAVLDPILGVSPREHAIKMPEKNQLIFARTLYQPVHQACNTPSPSLWAYLRRTFLLPLSAPAIFNSDWTLTAPLPAKPMKPPAASKLAPDWAVVLAQPPSSVALRIETDSTSYYHADETAEQILQSNFWFGNVATFTWSADFSATKSVFNSAALFITTPGAAMAQLAFLPPGSAVLLIQQSRDLAKGALITHSGMSAQMKAFGVTSSLAFATLFCPPVPNEPSTLTCTRDKFSEGLTWAADYLFKGTLLPGSSRWAQAAQRIPGSGLKTDAESASFRQWAQCVSERGRWVLDPKPRPLPWPHHGSLERCDKNHVKGVKGGVAGEAADKIAADPRADPASWTVREGAKYVWKVDPLTCPAPKGTPSATPTWVPFKKDEFCRDRGWRRLHIVVLGDSIQNQVNEAIAQNILVGLSQRERRKGFHFDRTQQCKDWLRGAELPHEFCTTSVFAKWLCPGVKLEFIRNDLMDIYHHEEPVFDRIPWAVELKPHLDHADVIIINRGPHFTPMPQFERGLKATCRLLRRWYPTKLLMYRNTPPGHLDCTKHFKPLAHSQDPKNLPYNWGRFEKQNRRAEEIVEQLGIVYMDVVEMTALRADGHKGFWPELNLTDCLHYCSPGPIDTWVQLLFNMLRHLKLKQW